LNEGGGHKLGRNDPCPCGSGKKYKHCCLSKREAYDSFYTRWEDCLERLDPEWPKLGEDVYDTWFYLDCRPTDPATGGPARTEGRRAGP
jgi:hypothetical protein